MCGITGIYHFDREKKVDLQKLQTMTELLTHRGPDDSGYWEEQNLAFGHRRLSIIDLSDAGHQPMIYNDRLILTYNGEIYNYLELRKELKNFGYTFKSDCDTEVILAAYSQWGEKCVNKFNGMWAFALWDKHNQRLFCSRDRFGIKPFHYLQKSGTFYFASEAKALYSLEECLKEINYAQLQRFLQLGWVFYHEETLLHDIKNLPAAHNLIIEDGEVYIERYWNIEEFETDRRPFEEKAEEFASLFQDVIEKHMRSDVSVGSCLSGGLDSSSIVSQIQASFPENRLNTFSVYYSIEPEYDERQYIKCFSDYETIKQHLVEPRGEEISDHFMNLLWHQDFPTGGSSTLSQYFVMKLARENNVKVVLDGQGGDEILAGYHHHFFRYYADLIANRRFSTLFKAISKYKREQDNSMGEIGMSFLKSLLLYLTSENLYYNIASRYSQPDLLKSNIRPNGPVMDFTEIGNSRLSNILYKEVFTTSIPNLLHYEDRNSMAFSVESRVPFLDYRLVEFCFKTLSEDKLTGSNTKYLLRKGLGQILPKAIKNRKDKVGFVTPGENYWLRQELRPFIEKKYLDLEIWNMDKIDKIIREFLAGDDKKGKIIWRLMNYIQWQKNML